MNEREKRHNKYIKNKIKELEGMKRWQEQNKKNCSGCGKAIRYRSKLCRSCTHKEEKSDWWKGDEVGYVALHAWVRKRLGQPNMCCNCGNKIAKRYDWANISYLYKRDINDWIRLCRPCHWKMDNENKSQGKDMTALVVD